MPDQIAARFARDTADHQLTVLHDDELYRHLRYANPQYGGLYRYDLITWPNGLTIRGDGPNFVFALYPTADLFGMFRGTSHYGINPGYWQEKVVAGQIKVWSEGRFRDWLTSWAASGETRHPGLFEAVREQILDNEEYSLEFEEFARHAAENFNHAGHTLRYPLAWEQSFDDWSWEFLWACHAIVWGIAAYDQHRAAQAEPVPTAAPSA
jgi:hypothetical protein